MRREKRCVIYCRVSTEKETRKCHLSRQEEELEDLAAELDLEHVATFKDKHSGYDIDREGLLKSSWISSEMRKSMRF